MGWCTAVTEAPGTAAPLSSATEPVMAPVVTDCANAKGVASMPRATNIVRIVFISFIKDARDDLHP